MRFNFPAIKLPVLRAHLKGVPVQRIEDHFAKLAKKLNQMAQAAGNNDRFQERINQISECSSESGDVLGEINTSRDIRAVVHLWLQSDEFIKTFPVTAKTLATFTKIRTHQGQLALYGLTQLFFKRFDHCGDINALTGFLKGEFKSKKSFFNTDMENIRLHADYVISLSGPEDIVAGCIKQGGKLKEALRMAGIPNGQSGRYVDKCRQQYYIETIKHLNVGDNSKAFSEVVQENVAKSPYNEKWLGHEVIKIMIEKVINAGGELPDNWRDVILNIAEDPRISDRSQSYREWWSLLPSGYVEAMQGWLAGLDLKLFLQALENHAKASHDPSLTRMFPSRARFLQGLYEHGLIKFSKLFIGHSPGKYLRSLYDEKNTPRFSRLNHNDLSVIYLKVGHVHMVEGSHLFSLRIFHELPDRNNFLSYSKQFQSRSLGIGLAEKYAKEFSREAFSITHNPNLTWQNKVICELERQGISVKPDWVLTPDDYKEYRTRFALNIQPVRNPSSNELGDTYFIRVLIDELSAKPRQTAREIAHSVKLDKKLVNRLLYKGEGTTFEVDTANRWSLMNAAQVALVEDIEEFWLTLPIDGPS